MNFHHSGAVRGRRFPWFPNGHLKTTKLTFADSEPTDPASHSIDEMAPGGGEPAGGGGCRRLLQRGVDALPRRAGHVQAPQRRRIRGASTRPRNDRRALPDDARPGAHHSNPPPPALLTTPPALAPVPPSRRAVRRSTSATRGAEAGGKYFFTRNMSAVCAFAVGGSYVRIGFVVVGAHTGSPCPKLKPSTKASRRGSCRSDAGYGGGLWYVVRRDLGVAGRRRQARGRRRGATRVKIDRPVASAL